MHFLYINDCPRVFIRNYNQIFTILISVLFTIQKENIPVLILTALVIMYLERPFLGLVLDWVGSLYLNAPAMFSNQIFF